MYKIRKIFEYAETDLFLELGINEFYDNSDYVGLFDSELDPQTFLSIEKETRQNKAQVAVSTLTLNLSER